MANNILGFHGLVGATYYRTIRDLQGYFYSPGTGGFFETLNTANWTAAKYCVPVSESPASSGYFPLTFPSSVALVAGRYRVDWYLQLGSSPTIYDEKTQTDEVLWDGTAFYGSTLDTDVLTIKDVDADTAITARATQSLQDNNLDHLMKTATASADMTTEVPDNTALARLFAGGDTSTFTPGTHDLKKVAVDAAAVLVDTGTDGVALANDAITSAKFDESTAYPLKSADTGSTQVARVGADGDTLETLSDQVDGVETGITVGDVTLAASQPNYAPAKAGDAMALTSSERNSIAAALLDLSSAVDTKTVRETLRIIAAVLAGKVTGAGTGSEVYKGLDGTTTRVTATIDSSGNRSAVTVV